MSISGKEPSAAGAAVSAAGAATVKLPTAKAVVDTVPERIGGVRRCADNEARQFGDYQLIREIGRGGMGVVYKARQIALDRIVALKMILPGTLANEEELQRFRVEVEATARLQHPNIVSIHEVGEFEGHQFYSMDFIAGPSLAARLKDGPLPSRTAAEYVRCIARAIHHAHCHQILHRDLKPSNILLDSENQPHVMDFGLAKKLGRADSGKTKTGAILGTPSYMAPEQAAGKIRELGPACDIYGLGALLYELLTGRPPFQAESPLETLLQVLERDAAPPRLLNPNVDRDLEIICLKCLEKNPRDRYGSAEQLALDLDRYLSGESIHARSFNVLDRLSRTLDRSQGAYEFRGWGNMVLAFAAIIFVEHVIVFLINQSSQTQIPLRWVVPLRTLQFAAMGGIFYWYRRSQILPTSASERQLWSIWIGYMISIGIIYGTTRLMEWYGGPAVDLLALYPMWATLSGLCFFIMGSNYWGRFYAYGALFFGMAALMPLCLAYAPIELGMLWALCLTNLGLYLRRLGKAGNTAPADSESATQCPAVSGSPGNPPAPLQPVRGSENGRAFSP